MTLTEAARERHRVSSLAYYYAHKEQQYATVRAWQTKRRQWLNSIKLERGCVDCGYNAHAVALHFDHVRDGKIMEVSVMLNRSSEATILREIAKCEVRCANCHAVVTESRRS